jgi:hypothetical protein
MSEKIFKPEKPNITDTLSDLEFQLNFQSDRGKPKDFISRIENDFKDLRNQFSSASLDEKKKALEFASKSYYPGNPKNINQEIIGLYAESGQLGIDRLTAELIEAQKEKLKDQFNDATEAGITIWKIVNLARELVPKADNIDTQPLIEESVKLLLRDDDKEINYLFQDLLDCFALIGEPATGPILAEMGGNYNVDYKSARKIRNLAVMLKMALRNSNVKEKTKELASQRIVKFLNKHDRYSYIFMEEVIECLADIGEVAIKPLLKTLSDAEDDYIDNYADTFSKMTETVKSEKLFEVIPIFESALKDKNLSAYQIQKIEEDIKKLKEAESNIKKKAA